jgi:hypothetical protein
VECGVWRTRHLGPSHLGFLTRMNQEAELLAFPSSVLNTIMDNMETVSRPFPQDMLLRQVDYRHDLLHQERLPSVA